MIGGALADRLGRVMLLFGLVFSAATAVLMGVVNELNWFFADHHRWVFLRYGSSAQQAMVADLLPIKTRRGLLCCA